MVGKPDLAQLAEACDSRMLPYARSVYFALLELANDQRSEEVAASRTELAQRAGVSVATLKRCVPAVREAGLVTMREVPGYPNVWTLLGAEGGSERAEGGGSEGTGGRVQESRGAGLTEPPLNNGSQEGKNEEVESPADSRGPDELKRVWAHYQETLPNGKRCQLNAARRLLIQKALKVRSAEECRLAITALAQSEYHVQHGFLDLKYALLGGGRNPTPEATIDRLIAQSRNGTNGGKPGLLKNQIWPDGRSFDELTPAEQAHARDRAMRGERPWEPPPPPAPPASSNGNGHPGVTAETFLSE